MYPKRLTERQKEILFFLHAYIEEEGYAPSFREILEFIGAKPSSVVAARDHLDAIEKKGYIKRARGKLRAIRITPQGQEEVVSHLSH